MGANMGKNSSQFFENIQNAATGNNNVHIVMLGLDSAGKTTVLYRLKFDQYLNTVPTIGFNCEKIKGQIGRCKGINFLIWDVGGQEKLRPLWKSYTRCTDGIIFVIDSTDLERMEEVKIELLKTIKNNDNFNIPILILANKQDLPNAIQIKQIEKILSLNNNNNNNFYYIQSTCAITGDGLHEGINQLYELILKKRKLNKEKKHKIKK